MMNTILILGGRGEKITNDLVVFIVVHTGKKHRSLKYKGPAYGYQCGGLKCHQITSLAP